MEVVESAVEVPVVGTQEAEGTTAELDEVLAERTLSLFPGTSQSKTTFYFSRAVAEVV